MIACYNTWHLQCACLARETHLHSGANSSSRFGIRFEPSTRESVLCTVVENICGLAAIGDVRSLGRVIVRVGED